jgi:hypothetical protein
MIQLSDRRIYFNEDKNLLLKDTGITHHTQVLNEDEELYPSLDNFIFLTWLRLIHPELPRLVKQRYGTDLRAKTLASIKPEISQAFESLLEDLRTAEDTKAMRTYVCKLPRPKIHPLLIVPQQSSVLYTKQLDALIVTFSVSVVFYLCQIDSSWLRLGVYQESMMMMMSIRVVLSPRSMYLPTISRSASHRISIPVMAMHLFVLQ